MSREIRDSWEEKKRQTDREERDNKEGERGKERGKNGIKAQPNKRKDTPQNKNTKTSKTRRCCFEVLLMLEESRRYLLHISEKNSNDQGKKRR